MSESALGMIRKVKENTLTELAEVTDVINAYCKTRTELKAMLQNLDECEKALLG